MVGLTAYESLVDVGWCSVNTTNSPLPSKAVCLKKKGGWLWISHSEHFLMLQII